MTPEQKRVHLKRMEKKKDVDSSKPKYFRDDFCGF